MTNFSLALFVVLSAFALTAQALSAMPQCSYFANQNITTPDIAAPKVATSGSDCCGFCASTPKCIAAVFDIRGFCHLKGTVGTVAAVDHTVIVPSVAPPKPHKTFVQRDCTDEGCSNCTSNTYDLGVCYVLREGGSGTYACTSMNLNLVRYPNANTCAGPTYNISMPLNACMRGYGDYYFENNCGGGDATLSFDDKKKAPLAGSP